MATNEDKQMLEAMGVECITQVFKDSLSIIEMLGLPREQFVRARKMILRSGNDEIRRFREELDKYTVQYRPRYQEVVKFVEEELPDNGSR